MENVRRFESNSLQKKHFAKIHEKVQCKYNEMQQKLNKSKSIDSLLNDNNYLFNQEKCINSNDLTCSSEVLIENRRITKQTALIEDVPTNNAVLHYVDTNLSRSESVDIQEGDVFENNFFGENFSRTSFESLNEVSKESLSFESLRPSTPPPQSPQKLSIRDKIGSRLTAAKEKRRKEEKAKNVFKDKNQKVEKMVLSNTTKQDIVKVTKRTKIATVTIALIEAIGLKDQASEEKLICRFRLGTEKYKSKTSKVIDSIVKWHEIINLNMYEDNVVEVTLWDKDTLLGRSFIDLLELEKERTHKLYLRLEELEAVELFILLTISGISLLNTVIDMEDYEKTQRKIDTIRQKFAWYKLRQDTGVGYLSMIVYGAKGLACSDCYCVIEMGNERLHTHTESKTNDPNWMKIFTFTVTDITSILEITIQDEKKNEEAGRISIPLLRIRNGHKIWYVLKDSAQREKARGNNPRILLEMKVTWNIVKSSLHVIQPKENKYIREEEKFDRRIFSRNITRSKAVVNWILDAFRVVKTCFEWESRKWNVIALTIWLLACYFFKAWMLPLMLLIPFIWYRPQKYYLVNWRKLLKRKLPIDDDEDIKSEKEEKNTSLRQKINSLQEMVLTVQTAIGKFASLGESIKNLFNFTVPYLSCLAIFICLIIALVMYLIPVKYIFMCWGVHKFTRKILRPNRIPNNEILDLLSRVPDDETLMDCEILSLDEMTDEDDKIM